MTTVLAFFSEKGSPALGLTPVVKITDLQTSTIVIMNQPMLERGNGFYSYEFNNQTDRVYSWIADSITLNKLDRYVYGMIDAVDDLRPVIKFDA